MTTCREMLERLGPALHAEPGEEAVGEGVLGEHYGFWRSECSNELCQLLVAALAQPEEAREAVLTAALRWALSALDRGDGVLEYTGDISDGEAAQAVLADTSPAAAALLAKIDSQSRALQAIKESPSKGQMRRIAMQVLGAALAQPEEAQTGAAREAVLVRAVQAWADEFPLSQIREKQYELDTLLADTSPAAVALLADAEKLREALKVEIDALDDMVVQLRTTNAGGGVATLVERVLEHVAKLNRALASPTQGDKELID